MAKRVVDRLAAPPLKEPRYEILKDMLLSTFILSSYQRAHRLIQVSTLGNHTPLELMDKMLGLLGDHEACFLFKTLFMDQVPEDTRAHLIPQLDNSSPRNLALAVDKVMVARQPFVHAVSNHWTQTPGDHQDRVCRFHNRWEGQCSFSKTFCDSVPPPKRSQVITVQGNEEYGPQ
ncbi:hypothetical protein TCAL_14776 [Tigriopus californicus]|uniref:Uncharacterized protein n=1 Tax=Tigriopus californicus TaxID=6832 RepID=A0A553PR49_TIGCA|nr:hypothetical protein TCAL_14776 [Tigriopus californicus]